jgi:hypothetical protein
MPAPAEWAFLATVSPVLIFGPIAVLRMANLKT